MSNDFNLNEDMINSFKNMMNSSNSSDSEKMNNIKSSVEKGDMNAAISQISPEMLQNFSKMMANQNSVNSNQNENTNSNADKNQTNSSSTQANSSEGGFNLNNLDMNTVMKMSSAFGKMNNSNDPRANLLKSLKPYVREGKKDKLDTYMNLLNMTKLADTFKNNNSKENS